MAFVLKDVPHTDTRRSDLALVLRWPHLRLDCQRHERRQKHKKTSKKHFLILWVAT
jgi:hypothetical protein